MKNMGMSVDRDQGVFAEFIWENQSWGDVTNSRNLGESIKQKLDKKPMNQNEGIYEKEVLVNRKRSRGGVVIRSENNITNGKEKDINYRDSDHEMHIFIERERRKKMSNLFANLHALLPELPSKADKSTIVDAAVKKIKNLQEILEMLEKKKQKKLKYVSQFGSESSFVMNSQWNPYESRETIRVDQGCSNYDNKLPINAIGTSNLSNALSLSATPPQRVAFKIWSSQNVVLNICGGEAQFCICATKKSSLLTTIALVLENHRVDVVSANIMCNGIGNIYMIQAREKHSSHDVSSMEETYKQVAREIMMQIS